MLLFLFKDSADGFRQTANNGLEGTRDTRSRLHRNLNRFIFEFLQAIAIFEILRLLFQNREDAESPLEQGRLVGVNGRTDLTRSLHGDGTDGIPHFLVFYPNIDLIFRQSLAFISSICFAASARFFAPSEGAFCTDFGCPNPLVMRFTLMK